MKRLAIIGASYLQEPLIRRAKEMGIETHVFAWKVGDIGERIADFYYPISIVEKDEILNKCIEIGVDGVCSIASDLATLTVSYVAEKMGLVGNSIESSYLSTNKHLMREAFYRNNNPSPKSLMVSDVDELIDVDLEYPVIVKPLDRSGSRGVSLCFNFGELSGAVSVAKENGFEKKALVEEYVRGQEYSVECLSYNGEHHLLQLTYKFTTGSPNFIETGHLQPAPVSDGLRDRVKDVVFSALDSLKIKYGASHCEIKIDEFDNIKIIEIGGRMGGDFIGSDLVYLSTGVDFVGEVIEVALGNVPSLSVSGVGGPVAVKFIFNNDDLNVYKRIIGENRVRVVKSDIREIVNDVVMDSSGRNGYYLFTADNMADIYSCFDVEIVRK